MRGHVREDKHVRDANGVLWSVRTRGWIQDQALYWGAPCVTKSSKFKRECTAQSHAIRKLNHLTGGGADGQKYGQNRYVDWELGSNRTEGSCGDESEHDTDFCEPLDGDNFRTDLFIHGGTSHEIAEVRYWTKATSASVGSDVQRDRIKHYTDLFKARGITVRPSVMLRDVKTTKGTGWAVKYLDPCQCKGWYAWAPRADDEDGTFNYHRSGGALEVDGHIYFTDTTNSNVPKKVKDRAVDGDANWMGNQPPPNVDVRCRKVSNVVAGDRYTTCVVLIEPA